MYQQKFIAKYLLKEFPYVNLIPFLECTLIKIYPLKIWTELIEKIRVYLFLTLLKPVNASQIMQYLLFVPLYRQIQRLLRYIETLLIIICICYTLFIVAVVCCCCYSRALHYKENGGALMGPGRRRGVVLCAEEQI